MQRYTLIRINRVTVENSYSLQLWIESLRSIVEQHLHSTVEYSTCIPWQSRFIRQNERSTYIHAALALESELNENTVVCISVE